MSFLKIFNCWAFLGIPISELCCQVLAFEWLCSWILKVPRSHVLFHYYWVKKLEDGKLSGLKEETLILIKHEKWSDSDMLHSLYLQEVYTDHPKQPLHSTVMKEQRGVWKNDGEWLLLLLMSCAGLAVDGGEGQGLVPSVLSPASSAAAGAPHLRSPKLSH